MNFGLGALYAPPRMEDGKLLRGTFTSNSPEILSQLHRDRWVVCHCDHGAFKPPVDRKENVDLFQADRFYNPDAERLGLRCVNAVFKDFTDPEQYKPLGIEKQYDVIYNACWYHVKRHNLFLEALHYALVNGRPISAILYGYHWRGGGIGTEKRIEDRTRAMIEQFKLPAKLLDTSWDSAENNRRYNLCRVCVLCSTTEAGPRVFPEANLAGLPYITTRDTFGGSPSYINEFNGLLCDPDPKSVAEAIWLAIDQIDSFRTRWWALENMSKPAGERKLREALQSLAAEKNWSINYDLNCGSGIANDWAMQVINADAAVK